MGQYHLVVNLDKKQYLHPHAMGAGLKLLEWGCGSLVNTALAVLLADANGRGGGDLRINEDHPHFKLVGSWAGDRIVVAGDYSDKGLYGIPGTLYRHAQRHFECISPQMLEVLACDSYIKEDIDNMRGKGFLRDWTDPREDYVKEEAELNELAEDVRRKLRSATVTVDAEDTASVVVKMEGKEDAHLRRDSGKRIECRESGYKTFPGLSECLRYLKARKAKEEAVS